MRGNLFPAHSTTTTKQRIRPCCGAAGGVGAGGGRGGGLTHDGEYCGACCCMVRAPFPHLHRRAYTAGSAKGGRGAHALGINASQSMEVQLLGGLANYASVATQFPVCSASPAGHTHPHYVSPSLYQSIAMQTMSPIDRPACDILTIQHMQSHHYVIAFPFVFSRTQPGHTHPELCNAIT